MTPSQLYERTFIIITQCNNCQIKKKEAEKLLTKLNAEYFQQLKLFKHE